MRDYLISGLLVLAGLGLFVAGLLAEGPTEKRYPMDCKQLAVVPRCEGSMDLFAPLNCPGARERVVFEACAGGWLRVASVERVVERVEQNKAP